MSHLKIKSRKNLLLPPDGESVVQQVAYSLFQLRYNVCFQDLDGVTNEHRPFWKAVSFSASQEIPHILWNPKFHYGVHKIPPLFSILSQIDPVHVPTSHFLKIRLNINLPSKLRSSKWSLSLTLPQVNPVYTSALPSTCYMPSPFHSLWFDHPKKLGKGYKSLSSSLCSFLHSPITSSLLGSSILIHPKPAFLSQCEWPSLTPIQNKRKYYSSVYLRAQWQHTVEYRRNGQ